MNRSITAELADLAANLPLADVPSGALQLVELAFIDAIGCVLAGSQSDEARILVDWALALRALPEATVLGGRATRLPAAFAALVNATAGHALDLDDVSPMMTHPSTCLVPPLLATAERMGSSGEELMMAYIAGFEVCVRLCRILNPGHYYRGWHSMGTVNVLGVAAGVARLIGLDASGVRRAMAIAASSSAGIRKNFGTMVKPLHAGQTAYHGLQSAELAAAGFVADDSILDGQHGFLDVFGEPDIVVPRMDSWPLEIATSGLIFKRYACCGALHPAIDAMVELLERHDLDHSDIRAIHCAVNSRALDVLVHDHADTPAEGRFCVEYSLAVAAIDHAAGPAQYTPERVANETVQALARRVQVFVDDDLPTGYALFPAVVSLETSSGATVSMRVDLARGVPEKPFTANEIRAKFAACASFVLDEAAVTKALNAVEGLRDARDVGPLVRALSG
jgi:2-methylcitrate dehydratase PrpD